MSLQRTCIIALTAIIALIFQSNVWAGKVKPLNLSRIAEHAEFIFEGECSDIKTGKDEESGFLATWYTFKVIRGIKGDLGETFTFKQFGGSEGEKTLRVPTVKYDIGEVLILFLYGKSKIGFTSAVGMQQGKFFIKESPDNGVKYVTNGMPAALLFENMDSRAATLTPNGVLAKGSASLRSDRVAHDEFIRLVKNIVEKQKKTTQER